MTDLLFWASLSVVLYTYVGFFALVRLVSLVRSRPVRKGGSEPPVSMIVAAYNEERVIREKIENSLKLDYPKDRLEILVAADGSSDRTADIAREYADRGVRVLHEPERRGKTMALNRAAPEAKGEILFFSDANTFYEPDTVRKIARNFGDPEVGGVSGRKVILEESGRRATKGEKGFWGYEALLKILETRIGSISTADGEIFAVRKALFRAIPRKVVHDDMYLTLDLVRRGYRVVYEPEATSAEAASKSLKDEFFLKTRYASAGYPLVWEFRDLLLPPRGWFGFQFLSHKLLRWAAPFPLALLFASSLLSSSPWIHAFGLLQAAFYAAALAGGLFSLAKVEVGPLYFPLYFCMGNGAALYGFFKAFGAGQSTLWRKAER